MAKKNSKKRVNKKKYGWFIALIVIVLLGYIVYINMDKIFLKEEQEGIVVNGELISSVELENNYRAAKGQNEMITRENFIEQMITLKLLLQEADKEGITVQDDEVEKEIDKLVSYFGSMEELQKQLESVNTTKEILYDQIKKQMIINKLINMTIISKIEISDSDVRSFYDSNEDLIGNLSFDDVKDEIVAIMINEKRNNILSTYIKQIRSNADIKMDATAEEEKMNGFVITRGDICEKDGKPIIRLFSAKSCSQCNSIKDAFDSTIQEFVETGEIVAYHWELDTGDNTLTTEQERGVPRAEVEIFKKYNKDSTVPTYVFGCKYVRIGNAYKTKNIEGETAEIKSMIEKLINSE